MLKLFWTEQALNALDRILLYCLINFSEDTAEKVRLCYEKTAELLSIQPFIGRKEERFNTEFDSEEYRSFPVNNLGRIVYRIQKDTLVIINIWDLRSNY